MVYRNGLMARSIKVYGTETKQKAKEPFGMLKETFTLENLCQIKLTDLEYTRMSMEVDMKVSG